MRILLFEDKLGVTPAYESQWDSMVFGAGFLNTAVIRSSVWKKFGSSKQIVIKSGNRKTPGFNPDASIQKMIREWFTFEVNRWNPDAIIVQEAALLGLFESRWAISMIDYLRGGIYPWTRADGKVIPILITVPISAINTSKKTKDIRAMNQGAESKSEWEEQRAFESEVIMGDEGSSETDSEEFVEEYFFEPYTIPYGRWVLASDLRKLYRITQRGYRHSVPRVRVVTDRFEAKEAFEFLMESKLLSSDIETIPDQALITVNGYTGVHDNYEKRTYVFPWYNDFSPTSGIPSDFSSMFDYQRRLNDSGIPFTLHNGPYDLYYYNRYHMPVRNYAYDSMTMFWSFFPELPKRLDFVSSIMLDDYVYWKGDRKSDSWYTYLEYNGKDCDRTLQNTMALIHWLSHDPRARKNFIHAHMRVVIALGMSMRGMLMDLDRLAEHGADLASDAAARLESLRYILADSEFNPASPKQRSRLLYDLLGVKPRNSRGRYVKDRADASTGAVVLRAIRHEHPVFRRVADGIIKAAEPAKQISNVVHIKRAPYPVPRVYTGYSGVGTTTTRLASSEPPTKWGTNLQNIRAKYRDFLVAEPGHFLLDMDLSAGDDVFVTYESADPRKIELHRSGLDSHSKNATLFFTNWTYEEVVRLKKLNDDRVVHPITGIRQITKKLAHGCNYLMAALTLLMTAGREAIVAAARELGHVHAAYWTQEELVDFCVSLEEKYRGYYTRFKRSGEGSWYMDLKTEFWETGGFTTPFHYFQRFLGDPDDDKVHRALAATAGQAGTAGRINAALEELVLGYISPTFRDAPNPAASETPLVISQESHGISLRLQTHDSITWDINPEHPHWEEGVEMIQTVMRRPVVIKNKITGELETFIVGTESGVGPAWGKNMVEVKTVNRESVNAALAGMENNGLYVPNNRGGKDLLLPA